MAWREPRGPREAVDVTCEHVRELAEAYHPFVRWSDTERLFPVLVEAWLQHATSAPWPVRRPAAGREPPRETGRDPHRRGTAVCRADLEVRRVEVLGGTPDPDDRPLSLDPDEVGPHSLSAHRGVDGLTFLDVGGWVDDVVGAFRGRAGDLDYLVRAFSELAAAINPALEWDPVELMAHLPQFWTVQPPTPTVYCEVRWADDFAATSAALAEPDFPPLPEPSPLRDVLVLTYHYLFPAREPTEGEPEVRPKEGQWESVSVFFRGEREGDRAVFFEPPLGVAASQGTDGAGGAPRTEHRVWGAVARSAAHPIVFSARGTHRFFFEPLAGQPWEPGTGAPPAPDGGSYDNNSEFPGWETLLVGGLLIAGFIAAINPLVGLIVALVVLLLWLLSLIADLCNDSSENPANPNPSNPEAGGDGAQSGDPDGPPAPGSPGGGGGPPAGGDPGFGHPNTGSPTGRNVSAFDVRVVDRASRDVDLTPTGYPSARPCEQPTWWDYSGRWGVRVAPGLSGTWASGDRRVDEHGRSWGYWHTLRFLEELLRSG